MIEGRMEGKRGRGKPRIMLKGKVTGWNQRHWDTLRLSVELWIEKVGKTGCQEPAL